MAVTITAFGSIVQKDVMKRRNLILLAAASAIFITGTIWGVIDLIDKRFPPNDLSDASVWINSSWRLMR